MIVLVGQLAGCGDVATPGPAVAFEQSSGEVGTYDIVEIAARIQPPRPRNPFTDANLTGWFETRDGRKRWQVEGFADSEDGERFRIRFCPPVPGDYRYRVEYRQGNSRQASMGTFRAMPSGRRGPIRIDPKYPWHFVWEGTGEHYFFNGTTAYWLFGWRDDSVIYSSLERLHRLKINRVRVTIAGRPSSFFGEPVMVDRNWTAYVTPWKAANPDDAHHPEFDYSRFVVAYWQRIDRVIRFARERDMIIALVFDMNDVNVHPSAGSEDERRFIRYAIARFGAFPNVTWDLGDDLDGYRDNRWAELTGRIIDSYDPQQHLATTHPRPPETQAQPRTSSWVGFTSFQEWSRRQHAFMLRQRSVQRSLGRVIPQTNEEYGYEDHYPLWAPPPPGESADVLRRSAWDIAMAGGYQTTGETAKRGTNVWPNTGGGWINGRGDSTMTMLEGYAHMVEFFTSFPWWTTDPHDELVDLGNYCLADPGATYVIYLPRQARATIRLKPGRYHARWFDPTSGRWSELPPIDGASWTSPTVPDPAHDWAILLQRAS